MNARPILNIFELAVALAPSVSADKVIHRAANKLIEHGIFPEAKAFLTTLANHNAPYQALVNALRVCYD